MFQIEWIRTRLAKPRVSGGREYDTFELGGNGFLVTGYEGGGHWLVSPLGRMTVGGVCQGRADTGWAISQDRRDYHGKRLYVLDLPGRAWREVPGLECRWELDVRELDADRLVAICQPAGSEHGDERRDMVVIDLASARIADRFRLEGLSTSFSRMASGSIGVRDGRVVLAAHRARDGAPGPAVRGIARVRPAARQIEFTPFPEDQGPSTVRVSPSGDHVLLGRFEGRPPLRGADGAPLNRFAKGSAHIAALELWRGEDLTRVGELPLGWSRDDNSDHPGSWFISAAVAARAHWQPDEQAVWWVSPETAVCVGLDGGSSPHFRLTHQNAHACVALPGRQAEFRLDKGKFWEVQVLDGAPAADRSVRDAPAPVEVAFTAAEIKRQDAAQREVTALTKAKSELAFSAKSAEAGEIIAVIGKIATALERGLAWYADDQGRVRLAVKLGDMACGEARLFALAEGVGAAAAPALTQLVRLCARDADLSGVWFGDPEDGQQAFGAAARALGGVDAGAWLELVRYGAGIDAFHEQYFRGQVVPHFLKVHGWREESFCLALADILLVRGNLGDDFEGAWRRSGLAAAAAAYAPAAFAALMVRVRDLVRVEAAALVGEGRHGAGNYDRLVAQLEGSASAWEAQVFAAIAE